MLKSTIRPMLIACTAAGALLAWLPESEAAGTCCGPAPAVVTYSRPYAAGRVAWLPSYGVNSTCNPMVAGSCGYSVYRPVYQAAYRPVTAYMPTAGGNPCTSCASPCDPCASSCVTTYVSKYKPGQPLRNVFRVLLPPYGPRLQTVCYTPRTTYSPVSYGARAPVSCTSCYTTTCDPCCPTSACGTIGSGCVSGACGPATTTAPSNGGAPSTFKQEPQSQPELRLMPTPDASTAPATLNTPRLVDPESRTARAPVRRAVRYQPVSLAGSTAPALDVGGWRASRD